MRLPKLIHRPLLARVRRIMASRQPDFIIGSDQPYMLRWWLLPRNPLLNIYAHKFLRSDDDRALHDHPWSSMSVLLHGLYVEHEPGGKATTRVARDITTRGATSLHRVALEDSPQGPVPCITLFITGPRVREWRHWRDFCAVLPDGRNAGKIGRGCGEP